MCKTIIYKDEYICTYTENKRKYIYIYVYKQIMLYAEMTFKQSGLPD